MRRIKAVISVFLTCALLAGCGNKQEDTTQASSVTKVSTEAATEGVSETTTEAATEKATETKTESSTEKTTEDKTDTKVVNEDKSPIWNKNGKMEQIDAFPKPEGELRPGDNFSISKNMMKYYLDGSWMLIPKGEPIMAPDEKPDILSFDSTNEKMLFLRGDSGEYAEFKFSLDDLFSEIGATSNLLQIEGTDVSDGFSESSNLLLGMTDHFQIVLANVRNYDMLMLRPIGNGDSLFSAEGFGFDNARNGFWVFSRYAGEDVDPEWKMERINNVNEQLKLKNARFFAIQWFDMGGAVCLQPIDAIETDLNLYGDDVKCLCYNYRDMEYPLSAVEYSYRDSDMKMHSGYFNPALVMASTDSEWYLESIDYVKYYIYGYYHIPGYDENNTDSQTADGNDENQGTEDNSDGKGWDEREERDPDIFASWDELYCGTWSGGDNYSITINPASPQVGGFYLYFYFDGNIGTAYAYGDESGGLVVYKGESESDGGEFQGYLQSINGSLNFYVQSSKTDILNEGENFTYYFAE